MTTLILRKKKSLRTTNNEAEGSSNEVNQERGVRHVIVEYESKLSEAERKVHDLTALLSERSEQNLTLHQQAEKDLQLLRELQAESKKLVAIVEEQKALALEFQRRNEAMAVGLDMMARENLQLRAMLDEKAGEKGKAKLQFAVADSEQEMLMMQKISDLQHDLKRLDGSFKKAREAQLSSEENVDLYETELKMKKNYWKDAIAKEAKRRKAAESEAKRLKAKVDELEFLLDQKTDSSWSDSDSDEGEEKEEEDEQIAVEREMAKLKEEERRREEKEGAKDQEGRVKEEDAPEVAKSDVTTPGEELSEPSVNNVALVDETLSHQVDDDETVMVQSPSADESASESAQFEEQLKQRNDIRQQLEDERAGRSHALDEWGKQQRRSIQTSSPLKSSGPTSETAAELTSPSSNSDASSTFTSPTAPKKSLFGRLQSVFSPKPTSRELPNDKDKS